MPGTLRRRLGRHEGQGDLAAVAGAAAAAGEVGHGRELRRLAKARVLNGALGY